MGTVTLRASHGDMRAFILTVVSLGLLLSGAEGKRRGGGRARSGKSGERSWHLTSEGEESCGTYTELFTGEVKPSSQCTQGGGEELCVCSTRGDVDDKVEWNYACGVCQLRWKPTRDEEAVKKRKEEKKKASEEIRKQKKEMRTKMRQKLKGRDVMK